PKFKTSRLWIDAICINQSDLLERNHQVAQMRDVYTKAESVIAWLGLTQGHEELAFLLTRHPGLIGVKKIRIKLLNLLNKPYLCG
ncbi:HET-domain-containing protein, partial [Ophiobolus disseminans]